jgi:hypothetical protein
MKFLIGLAMIVLSASPVWAAEVEIHGFAQGNYAARITGESPAGSGGDDFLLGEERLRLELASQGDQAGLVGRVDLFRDAVVREADLEIREVYIDYAAMRYDARVGRQIVTWGVGDLLFINDLFPKDWTAFFSGRPIEYLKVGVDGARLTGYGSWVNAELIIVPFFDADRLPDADRFVFDDPIPPDATRTEIHPETAIENTEAAVRLYRYIGNWDAALYAYRGFWRQPGVRFTDPTSAEYFFPELTAYGASTQAGILGGVVSLETGYYDSREDRDGKDPTVPNSQIRALAGYQRQVWTDFTAGVQYYTEWMMDHSAYREFLPAGSPEQDELRHLITLRLTQLLRYQTLRLSIFAFYSPSDWDAYVIPEVRYSFTDALWGAIGANLFGGEEDTTFFGQFDENDNIFVTARYAF